MAATVPRGPFAMMLSTSPATGSLTAVGCRPIMRNPRLSGVGPSVIVVSDRAPVKGRFSPDASHPGGRT